MSGTRSPFRTARVTEAGVAAGRSVLIIAHGSPSAPTGPEQAMRQLARRVAAGLPGWTLRGATLAAPGALEAALASLPDAKPLVFPFFMSDGWFVRDRLPQRLRAAGCAAAELLPPLGLNPLLLRLCGEAACEAAAAAGHAAGETSLLLAAHGSPGDPRPRQAAEAAARSIAAAGDFREVRLGFIDEPPFLADAARLQGPALCLPFFAGRAGHVEMDLPKALDAAAFPGPQLAPIGCHPRVADILRMTLLAAGRGTALYPPAVSGGEAGERIALP